MTRLIQNPGATAVQQPAPTPGGTADYTRAPLGPNLSGGVNLTQTIIDSIKSKNMRGPVILNGWDFNARDQLTAAGIPCLFYMDITSVRDDNVGGNGPCAASLTEANGHDDWFMHRNGGHYTQAGYSSQYWMNCPGLNGRTGWETIWSQRAQSRTVGTSWAGIMADNDMPTTNDYYQLQPNDEGADLNALAAGTLAMLRSAGGPMQQAKKLLVPNIGEAHLGDPSRWSVHSQAGGGAWNEMFLGWATDDNGSYQDPGTMQTQINFIAQTGAGGTGVAMMRCASVGRKRALFGYAAFLCGGGSAHGAYFGGDDTYRMDPSVWWQPEMGMLVGAPTGALGTPAANGITRSMTNGWAAANLNQEGGASITFAVPAGMKNPDGSAAPASVTLGPHYGAVYKAT